MFAKPVPASTAFATTTARISPFTAFLAETQPSSSTLRAAIGHACRRDESACVAWLIAQNVSHDARMDGQANAGQTRQLAKRLVETARRQRTTSSGVDALMQEFSLSSEEGIALMCMAEALLRIPDADTANRLIADKLAKRNWRRHLGQSPSVFVNATTWGLLITGKLVSEHRERGLAKALTRALTGAGEPLIRKAMELAMRMLGNQFVCGQTIGAALENSQSCIERGYQYSYDMLGEAATTRADAERYFDAYVVAIDAIGRNAQGRGVKNGPGISVKLSALHPRYVRAQRARVIGELLPRLKALVLLAKSYAIGINIDAEESDRLELSLDLLEALAFDPDLVHFDGLGFVVQAYQKRCPYVIDYLVDLAQRSGRKFMVRLVKGAYWDSEIKRAQVDGVSGYPVYTRKVHTDMSYLLCAKKLLIHADRLYPQFATHNAQTLAAVHTWAASLGVVDYEFQCLHGMGETLYDQLVGTAPDAPRCRIYAPVGAHRTLLAYLVRRLLENGANNSFVSRLVDPAIAVEDLIADPFCSVSDGAPDPGIVLPEALYGVDRENSTGIDLVDEKTLRWLSLQCVELGRRSWLCTPKGANPNANTAAEHRSAKNSRPVRNPADHHDIVGHVIDADTGDVDAALVLASAESPAWRAVPARQRAGILRQAASAIEAMQPTLLSLLIREAGKTIPAAAGEIREATDFLRFYAAQAEHADNTESTALGIVVCISPWNFPLAIFVGQISAALAAGNVVLAKPAEQTPLIAMIAVQLLHAAGVPMDALQLLPGEGAVVGAQLVADSRVCAVLFTGSITVAQTINRTLAARSTSEHRELPLIAETGGQNTLIIDSSALPEQVVQDVLVSAFDSAGQRCSALRVLCLPEQVADDIIRMLAGAMQELSIGSSDCLAMDIGPVIDADAQKRLLSHITEMRGNGAKVTQLQISDAVANLLEKGTFVLPTIIEIADLACLTAEVFGPVLHILRYRSNALPALIATLNRTGYGLTLGIHSRIDTTINAIVATARVGNLYINRSIIGAVVGSQPFGGEGLSGTGPKAGGPLYLRALQSRATTSVQAEPNNSHSSTCAPILPVYLQLPRLPQAAHYLAWQEWYDNWQQQQPETSMNPVSDRLIQGAAGQICITLPGPTGELNTLSFAPRGAVLCVATSQTSLLRQLNAVFLTGNLAIIFPELDVFLPQGLPPESRACIRIITKTQLNQVAIDAALIEDLARESWQVLLAARKGPLVQTIIVLPDQPISLIRLICERTVTTNTTAAGGNAQLLMSAS